MTVEVATPSATTGVVPVIVELAATAAPAMKVTDPSALLTGVAMLRVLEPAEVEVMEQVEVPVASVALQVP